MRSLVCIGFICLSISAAPALAQESVQVPPSAKKLNGEEIFKLYNGMRASFDNKQNKVSLTGEIFYDLDKKLMFGTYNWDNKDKGLFKGKAWVKGEQFCNKPQKGKETCTTVYLDGTTYYEVDSKGNVASVDTILGNPPPPPTSGKKMTADEVLAAVKGKRIFVTIFDFDKPVVADVKWDTKKKKSTGKFIMGGTKEGKANAAYVVKNDTICFPSDGKNNCYDYYATDNGFIEVNADGKVHGISTYQ
ncbi:MAG: hypothetical protein HC855_07825 [Rhizobiales bacterium]|nr:hypothetical protein [Hyphomicrobiales bacterium]